MNSDEVCNVVVAIKRNERNEKYIQNCNCNKCEFKYINF